jgi:hypothetical protein
VISLERARVSSEHRALEETKEFSAICMNTDKVAEPPAGARWITTSDDNSERFMRGVVRWLVS